MATLSHIYDGFTAAVAGGIGKAKAGILLDEHFGTDILCDAKRGGIIPCVPTEKSGQDGVEYDFEFGDNFARHIEAFAPVFCKVLVRYNPEGDTAVNRRQAARLKRLSEALAGGPSRFMFELLVPATPQQLEALDADAQAYDRELRRAPMACAISALQDAGVEIARRYRQWVDVFERAKAAAPFAGTVLAPGLMGMPQG